MEIDVSRYLELLWEENKKQNLFSRQAAETDLEQHVKDSLQGLKWMNMPSQQVVDIGSGAGFPAIILALSRPHNQFIMVESDTKKSQFLAKIINEMGLTNSTAICDRIEKLGHDEFLREKHDLCTSRAVAPMRILLEYGLPLLRQGGRLLMWKGNNYQYEIDEAENAMVLLGGKIQEVYHYNLMGRNDRVIVVVEKTRATPVKYPRRIGVPAKRPL